MSPTAKETNEQVTLDFLLKNIQGYIDTFKSVITNINDYMPLNNLFQIIVDIFNYNFNKDGESMNLILLFIIKFLISSIIIIMPIILLIITIIKLNKIIKKNKKYWWTKDKYNYLNTKYIYIKKMYNIYGLIISKNIFNYLLWSCIFIIVLGIVLIKFKKLLEEVVNFKKILYYNTSIFLIVFLIVVIYLSLNYNRYVRVYKYNKDINNTYIKYLNKDYIKQICNNFIDDNNNISDKCTFKKAPNKYDLQIYLDSLNIKSLKFQDLDLENDNISFNYSTQKANEFISALITHQLLVFIYDNQYKTINNDNKFCSELKLDTVLNNKIDNMFYCYNEKLQFPLTSDVEGELLNKSSNLYFDNYKVYTAIIDKYLQINNTLAKNITNIKKENIDEITITILIAVLFIIYLIGLFVIFMNDSK